MKKFFGSTVLALLAGCSAGPVSTTGSTLDELMDAPTANDGAEFRLTVYPYDAGDGQRYVMCLDPCDATSFGDVPILLIPLERGAFDGWRGQTPVEVSVIFNADCFKPDAVCWIHRPFVFEQY